MKLPASARSSETYRRAIWGNSRNIAYFDKPTSTWKYKHTAEGLGSSILSTDNKHANDWFLVKEEPSQFNPGDIVELQWISTHDKMNERRHELIHKNYTLLAAEEVKHPTMKNYKGHSKWYRTTLRSIDGPLEQINFQYVQMKMLKPTKEADVKTSKPQTKIKISYGNVSAIQRRIYEITGQKNVEKYRPIYSIKEAKKGDIVEFIGGGGNRHNNSDSFFVGKYYEVLRDYNPNGFSNSKTPEGQSESGTISVVKDEKGRASRWAAALFRIERKADETEQSLFV